MTKLKKAEDARPFIERAIGAYMGANPRKGQSFTWIIDHLRDGNRIVTPRSLVRLFENAAEREKNETRAVWPRLLSPTSLRTALARVSEDHVSQAISNEWPWFFGVRERVQGNLVPWERKEVIALLESKWKSSWGEEGKRLNAPEQGAKDLVQYLVQLGVLRERSDGRIDVPDIYLFGLGLRRKGGVRSK